MAELAKELGINKSKLSYYTKVGIIKSIATPSRMQLFDRDEVVRRLKDIKELQLGSKQRLSEIKKALKLK